ncbi:hypothetical protein BDV28DRAFT_146128 [Aspergillus coremiiformis]|uniref:N-acetylgalactosaminide beta-1,3-galactosyltransferase n=1 Tax=Aspergillus coremiiformis TaxID=138285 RepID=A0A5N6ZCT2_9EURO|nr:hypothetical protein BDV28DRAFT_146128 [Aspergillus coremiiformis]
MIPSRLRYILLLIPSLFAAVLLHYLFWPSTYTVRPEKAHKETHNELGITLISTPGGCSNLPGIHDILVVMKTGATEALQKIPVHFNTTLRCVPHFVVFSDFEEKIAGVQVHDVLRSVDEKVKQTHPDFDLYNRLRQSGRAGLTAADMNDDQSTPQGKPDNRGWLLDKWKFLPMINESLVLRADAKWYVFMEADTYVVWPNLVAWLEKFDPNQPYYMGSQIEIAGVVFGHGGSGFVISHAAMHQLADYHATRVEEHDEYTGNHWAGDCVLGKVFKDAGVDLFFATPMLQGDTPWTFSYYEPKHHWCTPVGTYHHMTADDIRETWAFEQRWWANTHKPTLLHADVFEELVHPHLEDRKDDWDNASPENHDGVDSLEDCQARCTKDRQCHQYSYESGKCSTSKVGKRGNSKASMTSGWMSDRINHTVKDLGSCEKIKWITL